ncbi:MAG TPA: hypothetical protein VI756_01195, partial [Blastocatellia bacterium]
VPGLLCNPPSKFQIPTFHQFHQSRLAIFFGQGYDFFRKPRDAPGELLTAPLFALQPAYEPSGGG